MVVRKDVLFTCSYLPEEIVEAAGFRPVRVVTTARPSDADTDIHPTTCPYIRAVFAAADRGDFAGAAGFVIVNSCDGMRRLYDALAASGNAPPAAFVDVPHKRDAAAVALFADILRRFAKKTEEVFGGSPVTRDNLERAIAEKNALRKKMAGVFAAQEEGKISGSGVSSLLLDAEMGGLKDDDGRIDKLLAAGSRNRNDAKRIVVSANVLDRPDLIDMIENAGGAVVVLDSCIGRRHWEGPVDEGTRDPIRAIAQRYLTRSGCPRMDGIGQRIDWLVELTQSCRADAVVLCSVKYCDSWLYDRPLLTESLQRAGVGVLALENDYEWSGAGQTRTRVEAFLETLPQGGK